MWNRETSSTEPTRQPQMPSFSPPPVPAEERRVVAWIGKSVIFRGELISSEDMTIDGRVEGTIEVRDHSLTIGPDADIQADVVAKSVSVRGKVTGTISANEKVQLCDTATIEGDIFSPRIAIAEGATMQGRVDTSEQASAKHSRAKLKTVV